MRQGIFIIFLFFNSFLAKAQQNFNVSLIPKDLLPYASAVIRNEEMNVEVQDLNNTIVRKKLAVTILNKNGDDMARVEIEHDKSTIIKSIRGTIYNEFGKQTGKFSGSDFDDSSAWDGFSLFTDERVKHYFPAVTEYPYTISYEYEVHLKQSLDFPQWAPTSYPATSIEKSTFIFSCKPDFNIRYIKKGPGGDVIPGNNPKGLKTYTWNLTNVKAIKFEPFSPYPKNFLTVVEVAPEKFTYYGISGSFSTWKELGKWEYDKLIANRQDLPQETIEHIRKITENITDPKLKAKKVYEYMQGKTHYVNVMVGIGGNQPFLAADVDKQNYGDCKALVNYTQALLKAINIESYYCVVEAGRKFKVSLLDNFPSMEQGNHIILCLPFKNDTTWADCTNQTIPFGYLGDFTDDRTVLACTPEGGKLMHTPRYTYQNNLESRKASFIINEGGELSGDMETVFKGTNYDALDYITNEPKSEQYKSLKRKYAINNLDIESLDIKQDKSFDPSTTESIRLHARDYASVSDGKYYFLLNPCNRVAEPPQQVRNRINPVYINRGYTDEDEITYIIPPGYRLEKIPLDVSIKKPFAQFSARLSLKGNQLIYKRKFQLIDGTYSKDVYSEMVDFYQDVVDADGYNVVLMK